MQIPAFTDFKNKVTAQFPGQQLPQEINDLIDNLEKAILARDLYLANHIASSILGGFIARALTESTSSLERILLARMTGACLSRGFGWDFGSIMLKMLTVNPNYLYSYCQTLLQQDTGLQANRLVEKYREILEIELQLTKADLRHYDSGLTTLTSLFTFVGMGSFFDKAINLNWEVNSFSSAIAKGVVSTVIDIVTNYGGFLVGFLHDSFNDPTIVLRP